MSQTELTSKSHDVKTAPGRAFLKVVAYPWGVEFELSEEDDPNES